MTRDGRGRAGDAARPAAPRRLRRLRARAPGRARRHGDRAAARAARRRRSTTSSLRSVVDGEPRTVKAVRDEETETDVWWRASFPVDNPSTRYRWLLSGGDGRLRLGERARRRRATTCRTRTTSCSPTRSGRPGLAPRLGRLRDLPRPLRVAAASPPRRRTGRCAAGGTSCRRAAGARRRTSSTAATSAGSRRGSTTSRRSAPTCST